jgi:FG-GAP repeat protein
MPNVPIVQKVVASDGAAQDWFGSALAVSGDLAVIGAPNATVNGVTGVGAAYVFRRVNGAWTQVQKLTANDGGVTDRFGQSLALLGQRTLVIGAPLATVNGRTWVGAVYVFTFDGTAWVQRQKILPTDMPAFGTFGKGVALTDKYLLIGAGGAGSNNQHVRGSVYVFSFSANWGGGAWSEAQRVTAPDPDDDTAFFGYPIAISGTTAIVGSYAATVGGNLGQGAAYAYKVKNGAWTQTAKLVASDGQARDNFGIAVALQGKTAFIGAPGNTIHSNVSQGSVYRFEDNGAQWTQSQQLVLQQGTAINWFGSSVAFQNANLLIGAYAINSYAGAAYIFGRPSANAPFALKRRISAPDGRPGDVFGYYCALDGNTALVSSWSADVGANVSQGAAYFFVLGGPTTTT